MQELTDYPRVEALLCRLTGADLAGEELPLELVIRMYRAQLRHPMEIVARYEDAGFWCESLMEDKWPEVKGFSFGGSGQVREAYKAVEATQLVPKDRMPKDLHETVVWLMEKCDSDWLPYDPAMALHQLTWPIRDQDALLALLEAELTCVPGTESMLLELAATTDEQIRQGL